MKNSRFKGVFCKDGKVRRLNEQFIYFSRSLLKYSTRLNYKILCNTTFERCVFILYFWPYSAFMVNFTEEFWPSRHFGLQDFCLVFQSISMWIFTLTNINIKMCFPSASIRIIIVKTRVGCMSWGLNNSIIVTSKWSSNPIMPEGNWVVSWYLT